jgi:hypothetical protein
MCGAGSKVLQKKQLKNIVKYLHRLARQLVCGAPEVVTLFAGDAVPSTYLVPVVTLSHKDLKRRFDIESLFGYSI